MSGFRDNDLVKWLVGAGGAVALASLAALNLAVGKAFIPTRAGGIYTVTYSASVIGLAAAKSGLAVVLFAWFFLANEERCERWAQPLLLAGTVLAIIGFLAFLVGQCLTLTP